MRHLSRKRSVRQTLENNIPFYNSTSFLIDPGSGLYVEDYFNEMIHMERLRSERSKRPFLLALIDIEELPCGEKALETRQRLARALIAATRETDFKGWYRCGAIMGVIYTEFDISDTGVIRSKLSSFFSMPDVLGPELLKRLKITFHVFPEPRDNGRPHVQTDLKLYPEVPRKDNARKNALRLKRALDITGSVIALIVFLPLFIIIPALVKLSSKGPVLFRQTRVGERGRPFTFLKFRSMHINGDERIHSDYVRKLILEEKAHKTLEDGAGKIYKIKDDPRVTRLGRWLRRTSLDELPQFFNVLKGDMSLVGPRPPIPYELENYEAWHLRRVVEAKPGITGLWQVRGRSLTTFSEMVRMDISYINGWSLWLDIKLILLTPWSMLTSRGAY